MSSPVMTALMFVGTFLQMSPGHGAARQTHLGKTTGNIKKLQMMNFLFEKFLQSI